MTHVLKTSIERIIGSQGVWPQGRLVLLGSKVLAEEECNFRKKVPEN